MPTKLPVLPLTKEQKAFADENTNLIYGYLCNHNPPHIENMDYDDWYCVAAEGYIKAVRYWFNKAELQESCTFSTVAYKCIQSEIRHVLQLSKYQCRAVPGGNNISMDGFNVVNDGNCDDISLYNRIPDNTDIEGDAVLSAEVEELRIAMDRLTEREQDIIRMRFIERLSLEATGQAIGLTRERVRQIEAKTLQKLKTILKGFEKGMPRGVKIPSDKIITIEKLRSEGKTYEQIEKETGVPRSSIGKIFVRNKKESNVNTASCVTPCVETEKEPAPFGDGTSSNNKDIDSSFIISPVTQNVKGIPNNLSVIIAAVETQINNKRQELGRKDSYISDLIEQITDLNKQLECSGEEKEEISCELNELNIWLEFLEAEVVRNG